jgi:hypothetical protein
MTEPNRHEHDRASLRYLDALEAADLETAARLWEKARDDPVLGRALDEIGQGVFDELGLGADWPTDAERVRSLLRQHLPSAFPVEEPAGSLTAGDVAARLQADAALGGHLDTADRAANTRLLADRTPLPEQLGMPQLVRWTAGLGVTASARYWRLFRQTAVLLAMGRCQRNIELAAARRAPDNAKENSHERDQRLRSNHRCSPPRG